MDEILIEEKEHLKYVISKMEDEIESRRVRVRESYSNLCGLQEGGGYDPHEVVQLSRDAKISSKVVSELSSVLNEPYHARMDFKNLDHPNNDSSRTFYIGRKDIDINFNRLVYGWQSGLDELYEQASERVLKINDKEYIRTLTRAFIIKNGDLKQYINQFALGDEVLDSGVTDRFLLEILKEKRQQTRMSDIIKTIQRDQGEIIRSSLENNIIVQGCAGSGKSMILLHRISYLLYHNHDLKPDDIIVLLPSEVFASQLRNVSKDLEIESVGLITVPKLYFNLLEIMNIRIIANDFKVSGDEFICENAKSYIFSRNFTDDVTKILSSDSLKLLSKEELSIIRLANMKLQDHSLAKLNHETSILELLEYIEKLRIVVNSVLNNIEQIEAELKEQKHIVETDEVKSLREELKRINRKISEKTRKEKSRWFRLLNEVRDELRQSSLRLNNLRLLSEKTLKTASELYKIKLSNPEALKDLLEDLVAYSQTMYIDGSKNDSSKQFSQFIEHIKECIDSIDNVLTIEVKSGFFRRLIIKISGNPKISSIRSNLIHILENMNKSFISLIEEEKVLYDDLIIKETDYSKQAERVVANPTLLEDSYEIPSVENVTINSMMLQSQEIMEKIESATSPSKMTTDKLNNLKSLELNRKIERQLSQIENSLRNVLKDKENLYKRIVERLIFDKFPELTDTFWCNLNRSSLFTQLVFYSNYQKKSISFRKYIFVDEAQDFSNIEFELLNRLVGSNSKMNVFGDINQSFLNSRSLKSWIEIGNLLRATRFDLNQNYRNTNQITCFLNKELELNIQAIGINGPSVDILSKSKFIENLHWRFSTCKKERFAIILKDIHIPFIENYYNEYCSALKISLNNIQEHSMNILDVTTARGLEFEIVYVIEDGMSNNERYVAFSRALLELHIVK